MSNKKEQASDGPARRPVVLPDAVDGRQAVDMGRFLEKAFVKRSVRAIVNLEDSAEFADSSGQPPDGSSLPADFL